MSNVLFRRLGILNFSIMLVVLNCHSIYASTYYVDYAAGSDANNGTSISTPFKHCPGDGNASNTASSTKLSPGDTVIFKGGVEYKLGTSGRIIISNSGSTTGGDIIYDGNSAETWGKGKAIINGQNLSGSQRFLQDSGKISYITIRYFEVKELGGYVEGSEPTGTCASPTKSAPYGAGIDFDGGGSNITIQDMYLHELGNWKNQQPFTANAITGGGIRLIDMSDVVIDNVTIYRVRTPIGIYAQFGITDNIEVKNSDLSWFTWGIDIAPRATNVTISNINIHDNKIHDYEEYDQAYWAGCGEWPHTDGIFLRDDYNSVTFTNINFHSNNFYSTYSGGGGTAAIFLSRTGANIYNNTFKHVRKGRVIAVLWGTKTGVATQVTRIYNNSFLDVNTNIGMFGGANKDIYIENNIFYHTGSWGSAAPIQFDDATPGIEYVNNNQFYVPNHSGYVLNDNGSLYTLASAQSKFLWWGNNGEYGNPNYTQDSFTKANSNLNNLHLKSNSAAIDAGKSFDSFFTVDKDGTIRPQGLSWDRGAYEFGSSGDKLKPMNPTNLLIN